MSHRAAKQRRQEAHKYDRLKSLAEIFRENREKSERFNKTMIECSEKVIGVKPIEREKEVSVE